MTRLAKVLTVAALAWFFAYGFTMTVNPPRGEAVLTADQQAKLDSDTNAAVAKAFDAKAVQVIAFERCEPVTTWKAHHVGQVPARMVEHGDGSGLIRIVPFTYPAAPGQWILALCSR